MNTQEFNKRLRAIITHYALSPSAFADLIQVQRSSISHIIGGRNKPSLDFVIKLNRAFPDINLYWVLNGTGDMLNIPLPSESILDPVKSVQENSNMNNILPPIESITKNQNEIDRIVVFHSDGTFSSYKSN